jgi:hypothetical protein
MVRLDCSTKLALDPSVRHPPGARLRRHLRDRASRWLPCSSPAADPSAGGSGGRYLSRGVSVTRGSARSPRRPLPRRSPRSEIVTRARQSHITWLYRKFSASQQVPGFCGQMCGPGSAFAAGRCIAAAADCHNGADQDQGASPGFLLTRTCRPVRIDRGGPGIKSRSAQSRAPREASRGGTGIPHDMGSARSMPRAARPSRALFASGLRELAHLGANALAASHGLLWAFAGARSGDKGR